MTAQCASCGAELQSRVVCADCGKIQADLEALTPFEVLGIEPSARLAKGVVRKRLLKLSRLTHPDFFTSATEEEREGAELASAALNRAQTLLDDSMRRLDWLVNWLGGPSESDERQMPQAFLMEVLEWNETLEEGREAAPGSAERNTLDSLEASLKSERGDLEGQLLAGLDPLPERDSSSLTELRRSLNAVRYIDRTLGEIRSLRLSDAPSPR